MTATEAVPASPGEPAAARARAKINLFLHVVGRRRDGYHRLESLVAFAAAGDLVSARPAASLSLTLRGPRARSLATEPDNLVLRAARLLAQTADVEPGAALTLVKRLPVASGIGGGSADAAATLDALARLWGVAPRLTDELLAARLGADVPACRFGRPLLLSGIGEAIAPAAPLPSLPLLLVNPGVPLATPAVFRARGGPFSPPGALAAFAASRPFSTDDLLDRLHRTANDLEPAAIRLAPAIARVLARLRVAAGCRLARMSGSGATCFAIFDTAGEVAAAARGIMREHPDWWVCATRLAA